MGQLQSKPIVGESKLAPAELAVLADACRALPAGTAVLEIGTYHGATAAALADAAGEVAVVSLDLYRNPKVDPAKWFANRRPNMMLFVGTAQALWALGHYGFELILIDAMHTRAAVLADLWSSVRMLSPTGRLFAHDYDPVKWPGVVEGIDEFCTGPHWRIGARTGSLVELVREPAGDVAG